MSDTIENIITDLGHGATAVEAYIPVLSDEWEFIGCGEGTRPPNHHSRYSAFIQQVGGHHTYALQFVNHGDPGNKLYCEDGTPSNVINAIWIGPDTVDKGRIVHKLLSAYRNQGGLFIEQFERVGRFDLGDIGPLIPEPPTEQQPELETSSTQQTESEENSSLEDIARISTIRFRHTTTKKETRKMAEQDNDIETGLTKSKDSLNIWEEESLRLVKRLRASGISVIRESVPTEQDTTKSQQVEATVIFVPQGSKRPQA